MNNYPMTVTLAVTGASGIAYGLRLLEMLIKSNIKVYLMFSSAAHIVLATETDLRVPKSSHDIKTFFSDRFNAAQDQIEVFNRDQWMAPVASGSSKVTAMIVCPCTSGAISAIAHGTSDNLIERAADVMIKEKRQLILVPRETPFSVIHLENMLKLARMGVTILPANPGFYQQPKSVAELVDFIVARILDHLHIEQTLIPRWGIQP